MISPQSARCCALWLSCFWLSESQFPFLNPCPSSTNLNRRTACGPQCAAFVPRCSRQSFRCSSPVCQAKSSCISPRWLFRSHRRHGWLAIPYLPYSTSLCWCPCWDSDRHLVLLCYNSCWLSWHRQARRTPSRSPLLLHLLSGQRAGISFRASAVGMVSPQRCSLPLCHILWHILRCRCGITRVFCALNYLPWQNPLSPHISPQPAAFRPLSCKVWNNPWLSCALAAPKASSSQNSP